MNPLGKRAYRAYCAELSGVLPAWEHLPNDQQAAWKAVASGDFFPEAESKTDDWEGCPFCGAGLICAVCDEPECSECDTKLTCPKCSASVPVNSVFPDSKAVR